MHLQLRVHRPGHREAGFTLIEIMTVVLIMAILAAILIPTFLKARAQSTVAASKANMKNIATALETYFVDEGAYPEGLGDLLPTHARSIPDEPCTNSAYTYAPVGGSPPADYKLSIAYPITSQCRFVVPGLSYTPAGGLAEVP